MNWRFNLPVIAKNYNEILRAVPEEKTGVDTLFIRGEKSNYIAEIDIAEIERRFTNYKIDTILNAGHWVHAEKPNEFFESVMAFVK